MKKICMLLVLLLAMALPFAALADEKIETIDELAAYLAQCREAAQDTIIITVPSALGKELTADDKALLNQLTEAAGIESCAIRVNRNTKLTFTDVVYGVPLPDMCTTVEAVRENVAAFLPGSEGELTLVCSQELFQRLFREGGMYRLMAELGVGDFTMKGNTKGHIFLSDIQMMTVPCAQVDSVSEAGERISLWREQNVTAFSLLFNMDAFNALTRDDYSLMAFLGGADDYRLSYNSTIGMLYFENVTYSAVPGIYCQSETAVVEAIRAMGAKGFTSFQLKLDQATYDAVYANRFARLYELQAQAGMTDGDLRYSSITRMLLIDNAVIAADATVFTSLREVTAHVEACAARGEQDITMLMSADVYADLMDGVDAFFVSDAKFYDLIANAGICDAEDMSFNRHSGAISLYGVKYYAGTDILRAVENGDLSTLTAREQQALDAAKALAADCARSTPAETALALHDALCARITYINDESTDEDDCCIGALLDGRANCDGYADALLLAGRLAGLNVRYQHGDSLNGGMGSYFSTHMWNLIELDGSWRMIDVTWDDSGEGAYHLWFNIGEDRASLSHIWSREMTVPMLAATDRENRPVAEYFAATEAEITAAGAAAQLAGERVFDVYVSAGSGLGMIAAREALLKGLYGSIRYGWIDAFHCLHVQLEP